MKSLLVNCLGMVTGLNAKQIVHIDLLKSAWLSALLQWSHCGCNGQLPGVDVCNCEQEFKHHWEKVLTINSGSTQMGSFNKEPIQTEDCLECRSSSLIFSLCFTFQNFTACKNGNLCCLFLGKRQPSALTSCSLVITGSYPGRPQRHCIEVLFFHYLTFSYTMFLGLTN